MRESGIIARRGNKTASEARESGIELRRGNTTASEAREFGMSCAAEKQIARF